MKENPFKLRELLIRDILPPEFDSRIHSTSEIPKENVLEEDSTQHLYRVSAILGLDPPATSSTELKLRLRDFPEKKEAYLAIQEAILCIREYEYFARRN